MSMYLELRRLMDFASAFMVPNLGRDTVASGSPETACGAERFLLAEDRTESLKVPRPHRESLTSIRKAVDATRPRIFRVQFYHVISSPRSLP
jgi:hypothetical protein